MTMHLILDSNIVIPHYKVPYFRDTSLRLLGKICMALKTKVYLPKDVVIFKGDFGNEMYIIRKGEVRVLATVRDFSHPILLQDGSFFGEIALVMEVRRTVTVKATTVCDLNVLSKTDFEAVLLEFPEFAAKMSRLVAQRQVEILGLTEVAQQRRFTMELEKAIEGQLNVKRAATMRQVRSMLLPHVVNPFFLMPNQLKRSCSLPLLSLLCQNKL